MENLHIDKQSYTTKDVSDIVGVEKHNIIQWEKEFGLEIARNALNHRIFFEKDIEVYKAIKVGKEKDCNTEEIRKALIESGMISEQMNNALQASQVNRLSLDDLKVEIKSVVQDIVAARDQSFEARLNSIEDKLDKIIKMEEERKNKSFWSKLLKG